MTANDLYERALALIAEEDSSVYSAFAVPLINSLIADTYITNNTIRVYANKKPLDSIPAITALTDELPCEDTLTLAALPYGLASKLLIDDVDLNRMVFFYNMYVNAVKECFKAISTSIDDVYGGIEQ